MADQRLYWFWLCVTALFVFSAVYSWFIALIVRRTLPGEVVWINTGLAFITGTNAMIRSNQHAIDPYVIVIIQRTMWFTVGVTMVAAVVMLGKNYNGEFSEHLPLSRQWSLLKRGIMQRDKERSDELAQGAGGDCGDDNGADHGVGDVAHYDGLSGLG